MSRRGGEGTAGPDQRPDAARPERSHVWYQGRPDLPALGLDLDSRTIVGGGSCPSQYEGKTTDGRSFFIHYRGGRLSIDVGEMPGSEDDMLTLLSAVIGPVLHGVIGIDQVCDLTGSTIDGAPVPAPSSLQVRRRGLLDFSGRTRTLHIAGNATTSGVRAFID